MADLLGLRTTGVLDNKAPSVPAASQAEVDAGTEAAKYVSPLTLSNYPPELIECKNTSGGTLTAGSMVYTLYVAGSGIEAKSPASASVIYSASAAVVVVGGANNATIKVSARGRWPIFYSSTAPSVGDYLILGAANTVTRQTYMSPEVIAIAMAAGSGGSVDAHLLADTHSLSRLSAEPIIEVQATVANSDWNGTINGAPSGSTVVYTDVSGDEDVLKPRDANSLAKLRLYNSTRSSYALISTVNLTTNTITLTAAVPGTWASGDSLTVRSQTNTNVSGSAYFLEYEFATSEVPELARYVVMNVSFQDTAAAGLFCVVHPYETYADSKRQYVDNNVAGRFYTRLVQVPLVQRRFTIQWQANASTAIVQVGLIGAGVASL